MGIHEIIKIDPEIMSGTPCFAGTRVPVQTLLDHVMTGVDMEEFLDGFPSVSREQAMAFLEKGRDLLIAQVQPVETSPR